MLITIAKETRHDKKDILFGSNSVIRSGNNLHCSAGCHAEHPLYSIRRHVDSYMHVLHVDYGCIYPMTYDIEIPSGSSDMTAYQRYSYLDAWTPIQSRTDTDFFNGIQAVRFDYPTDIAYTSSAFSPNSDTIYIKIADHSENVVTHAFKGISRYYDNRQAVVTTVVL